MQSLTEVTLEQKRALEAQLRFQLEAIAQIPPFVVEAWDDQLGAPRTWFYGESAALKELAFVDYEDRMRVQAIAAVQVARWTRAAAASKRVWDYRERLLREWEAARKLEALVPPAGAVLEETESVVDGKKSKVKAWKAPAEWAAEAAYRARPEYSRLYRAIEQAEEAHSACLGVVEGWQTVSRLLERVL